MFQNLQDSKQITAFRVNKSVSLVVILKDDFHTDRPLVGWIKVSLKSCFKIPQMNLSGYFVFTALDKSEYTLCVDSQYYFYYSEKVCITNSQHTVVYIRLKPKVQYPFAKSDTLLRGNVVTNGEIKAVVIGMPIATVAKRVQAGDKVISVISNYGRIMEGDVLKIGEEYCTVRKIEVNSPVRQYSLDKEIGSDYAQGTGFFYTVFTKADDNGEMVVYFRNVPGKMFKVELVCGAIERELDLVEGVTSLMGGYI